MKFNNPIKIIVLAISTIVLFSSCAASSSAKRYETKKNKVEEDTSRVVRFKVEPEKIIPDTINSDEEDIQDIDEEPDYVATAADSAIVKNLLAKFAIKNLSDINPDSISYKEKVIMEIIKYLNTPYKFGGNSWKGIDCSAFTQNVFSNTLSMNIPRSAREQYQLGQEVEDIADLQFGDLVFFNTRRRVKPGHVGIYIGENLFAHASRKRGVTVSSLDEDYYSRKYMGAKRMEGLPLN
ncbi:MAG: C40 family peptidase [Ignavibacteriales bacterium]|nr:C40 family peptidase [Ignavibacteriales bacterium]